MRVEHQCPDCKYGVAVFDGNDDYLSYPVTGREKRVMLYCPECEAEFMFTVKLIITATVSPVQVYDGR